MMRCLQFAAASVVILLLTACQAPQQQARKQANARWNQARADVKAKLAADQYAAGNLDAATAELSEAQRLDPQNPAHRALLVRILLSRGEPDAALATLAADATARTVDVSAADPELAYLRGVAYEQQQRWDEAFAAYREAATAAPGRVEYVLAAAEVQLQFGDAREALATLEAAAGRHGWVSAFQIALAECYEQLGNWPAAVQAWQRALGGSQPEPTLQMRLAEALCRADRPADAVSSLRTLAAAPELAVQRPRIRLMLADAALAAGQAELTAETCRALLQEDADNAAAMTLLAQALAGQGDYVSAARVAQQAVAVDGARVTTLELAAGLAWRSGQHTLALSTADRLLTLDAHNPVGLLIRSRAAERTP